MKHDTSRLSLIARPLRPGDLPQVLEMVHALAFHHGDAPLATLSDLERDALGDNPWLRLIVLARGDDLLGYAALLPLAQLQYGVRGMDLHHLYVVPAARGTGAGRLLVDAAVARAKADGCRYLSVGTAPDNVDAQHVYRALGFSERPKPGPRFSVKW